ncbi:phage antirepressor KilAC domain-containing protein [Azospirillum sp. sgz302134]
MAAPLYSSTAVPALIPFSFDGATFGVVQIDGELWFIGKDVAVILGYADPDKALRQHCKALKKFNSAELAELGMESPPPSGLILIPERDLYRLILRSNLPSAERFEEKVVGEVLPTIRRTGGYGAPQIDLSNPDNLLPLLAQYASDKKQLLARVHEMQPAVAALERLAKPTEGAMCITDAAKDLQVKPRALTRFLEENRWVYRRAGSRRRMVAYQDRIQYGHLEHKLQEVEDGQGGTKIAEQVMVTPKGRALLAKLLSAGEA